MACGSSDEGVRATPAPTQVAELEATVASLTERLSALEARSAANDSVTSNLLRAGMSCREADIARFDGVSWYCGQDEQLSEATVDDYVANNGFITEESDPTVNGLATARLFCGADMTVRFDGEAWRCATMPTVDEARVDSFVANNGYLVTEFDPTVNALGRAALSCTDGDVAKWRAGGWQCEADAMMARVFQESNGVAFYERGNVGIGTDEPRAALHVAGHLVVGDAERSCDVELAGAIRWTGLAFEGCNGQAWQVLSSPANWLRHSTRTCSQLGLSGRGGLGAECSTSDELFSCTYNVDWFTARDLCESAGARLCTKPETLVGAGWDSGCGIDSMLVWTSTPCDAGNYYLADGNPTAGTAIIPKCESPRYMPSNAGVRCCADD